MNEKTPHRNSLRNFTNNQNGEIEMSYTNPKPEKYTGFPSLGEHACFYCGGHIRPGTPVVIHDGVVSGVTGPAELLAHRNNRGGFCISVMFHPACANKMGQTLIADTWDRRQEWKSDLIKL
ncbi:hypothetical protein SKB45_002011 [Salmonella enterica]|nr:hypothetical protein [Salmonella enterica]ECU9792997.1 hypothetical protein [Salmonella enterica subsp. enterica serovar Sandiego]EDX6969712.1 hypothetical protein [Salmonella enterica subsp. enterica]EAO9216113.1 hypothetical protein [Salmonella enterica]EAQ0778322.1 hypothetical protein [Salmonella enterica]